MANKRDAGQTLWGFPVVVTGDMEPTREVVFGPPLLPVPPPVSVEGALEELEAWRARKKLIFENGAHS